MTGNPPDNTRELPPSPIRANYYVYERVPEEQPVPQQQSWIAVDKTIAMACGAVASAALAAAIAGATALVGKVDDTAQQVERARTERVSQIAEISRTVSIVETKLGQMIVQLSQLEPRIERSVGHDLESRDRRIGELERQVYQLRDETRELVRDTRRSVR